MRTRQLATIMLLMSTFAWATLTGVVLAAPSAPKAAVKTTGAPASKNALSAQPQAAKIFADLPPFPEDAKRPLPDFSAIDWEKEIVLLSDQAAFRKQVEALARDGRAGETPSVKSPARQMWDDEIMAAYHIPFEVQDLVRDYREKKNRLLPEKAQTGGGAKLLSELKFNLKSWQEQKSSGNATYAPSPDFAAKTGEIDIRKAGKMDIKNLIPLKTGSPKISVEKFNGGKKDAFASENSQTVTAPNALGESKIVDYYSGIEDNPVNYILYQLSSLQNPDGSFGSFNQYQITAEIVEILSRFRLTSSSQYSAMISYLKTAVPKDNREKAIKARIMKDLGEPYQTLLDELEAAKNADSGWGLKSGFASDPETTAEVAKTLYLTGRSADLTFVLGQIRPDGTMSYYNSSKPNLFLINKTAQTLRPFESVPTVNSVISTMLNYLTSRYDSEQKIVPGADLTDELRTLQTLQIYNKDLALQMDWQTRLIENSSFVVSNDTLPEAVAGLEALAQPDVVITAVVSNLQNLVNRSPANFVVTIKNQGFAPVSSLRLFNFVDEFLMTQEGVDLGGLFGSSFDPQEEIQATLLYEDTSSFIGNTSFEFYAESPQDADFANNWKTEIFNFAGAASNLPALPMYYIASKHSAQNNPAINVRWSQKADANRLNYVILYKKSGTSNWDFVAIDGSWNGAFVWPFQEGETYDVTAGVVHKDGQTIFYFDEVTRIRASANDSLYTGVAQGIVTVNSEPTDGLDIGGYGTFARTSASGNFTLFDLPNGNLASWIDELQYERLITKFTVPQNSTTTDVRLFTRLKNDTATPTINNLTLRPFVGGSVKNQNTLTIIAEASDNVALKEADFYYYKPDENSWVFVGSSVFQNGTQTWLDWFVPSALLGGGYKVKVVVWDFQGNQSESKESPVFTITDGTPPSGTILVEGLTDNRWNLGETKTIRFDLTSPSGITSLQNIFLQLGPSAYPIKNNYPIANETLDFTMPLNSWFAAPNAFISIKVYDNNLNYAVIDSIPFEITDPALPPHAPWGIPQPIEALSAVYPLSRNLYAAYPASDGSMEIVYFESDGLSFEDPGQYNRLVYRKFNGTEWLDPVIIKEHLYRSGQSLPASFSEVAAVQGTNSDIHIAYTFGVGDGLAGLDSADVYYARISGGLPAAFRQISSDNTASRGVQITVNSQGRVFLGWNEGYSYINGGTSTLRYMEGDGAGSWSGMSQLTSNPTGNTALGLENESPMFVFAVDDQFYFMKKTGGAWTTPLVINNPVIPKSELDKFAEDAAKLLLIVEADGGNPNQYRWLNAVKTKAQLAAALAAHSFVNKDGILESWRKNEYPFNSLNYNLFAGGGNNFHLFFQAAEDKIKYLYNVRHLNFSVNSQNTVSQTLKDDWLGDREAGQDIRNYKVLQGPNGLHHLLYIKQDYAAEGNHSLTYHGIYDGQDTYFRTLLTSPFFYAQEYPVVLAEKNSWVTAYFVGNTGGSLKHLFNSADYSAIIDYRLKALSPTPSSAVRADFADLKWSINNPAGMTYDVYFGENPFSLAKIAGNLSATSTKVNNLTIGKTYYWQVVAKNSSAAVYSNVWRFEALGPLVCSVPSSGDWQVVESCTLSASAAAPASVIVSPGAVLTVSSGAILSIDLKRYKLLVKKGGGVLIKKGGAIRQKR